MILNWTENVAILVLKTMSSVFEGYERQYCELSAKLSKTCTAAAALNGGNWIILNLAFFVHVWYHGGFAIIIVRYFEIKISP